MAEYLESLVKRISIKLKLVPGDIPMIPMDASSSEDKKDSDSSEYWLNKRAFVE